MDDPLSYFIVFLRKDQELDGLTVPIQYGIYDIVAYEHFDKTEHDLFNIMEKKNEEPMIMKSQNNNARPMEIFFVFVYNSSHDIRSSGTTVCRKDKSETCPAKECTNNNGHERLVM